MEGGYNQRSVEEVFRDFKGRRAGIIKALTGDVEEFYQQCDPAGNSPLSDTIAPPTLGLALIPKKLECLTLKYFLPVSGGSPQDKDNLCLYGFPNETWEVNLPAEEVPPELPEPALGINFARDGMQEKDWLSLVAVHSDAWLLAVSFYFGARFGFDRSDRKRLFNMVNELPTIFEVVSGATKKQAKEKSTVTINGSSKSKSSTGKVQQPPEARANMSKSVVPKDEDDTLDEEDDEEHGDTLCGACGENYSHDEFWIGCDICEKWFHGKCVKITPARAEHIKQYKCPACSNKRPRP